MGYQRITITKVQHNGEPPAAKIVSIVVDSSFDELYRIITVRYSMIINETFVSTSPSAAVYAFFPLKKNYSK